MAEVEQIARDIMAGGRAVEGTGHRRLQAAGKFVKNLTKSLVGQIEKRNLMTLATHPLAISSMSSMTPLNLSSLVDIC
jgi:hypothetical protein